MTKSIGYVVMCWLGLVGCSIERYDGDCGPDVAHGDDDHGAGARAGASPNSGGGSRAGEAGGSSAGSEGGTSAAGGSTGSGASGPGPGATCEEERDCDPGFNCDLAARECVPADAETCPELESEAACSNRRDCIPVYGGINCSCGQDCECKGGEPGCICESFDFFACQVAE